MLKKVNANAGALILSLVALAGCSASSEPSVAAGATPREKATSSIQKPDVDAAVVRGASDYDFEPTASVVEAASYSSAAIEGTVVSWSDGRSTSELEPSTGFEDVSLNAVLKVRVVDTFSSEGPGIERFVYVEVPRGGSILVNGEAPEGTEAVNSTIDELSQAVPAGSRVILLVSPAPNAAELEERTPGLEVRSEGAGLPEGAVLMAADVQGLLFEDENGEFVSGKAESEGNFGWIPRNVPASENFEYLTNELEEGTN